MTAPRSARTGTFSALADLPGSVAAGAFLIARTTGGRMAGTGAAFTLCAAAHLTLMTLFAGESLLRRFTG